MPNVIEKLQHTPFCIQAILFLALLFGYHTNVHKGLYTSIYMNSTIFARSLSGFMPWGKAMSSYVMAPEASLSSLCQQQSTWKYAWYESRDPRCISTWRDSWKWVLLGEHSTSLQVLNPIKSVALLFRPWDDDDKKENIPANYSKKSRLRALLRRIDSYVGHNYYIIIKQSD